MISFIKAEIKKIKRSTSVWLLPVLIIGLVAVMCGLFAGLNYIMGLDISESVGISPDSMAALSVFPNTGYSVTIMNLQSETLLYLLIIVFLAVSAFDFSAGAVKNLLSIGKSKKIIYTSKLLISWIWTVIAMIFYVLVSALLGYLFFQSIPTQEEIIEIALIALKQLPIYLSVVSLGHMLVFLTQRTAPTILIYIGFMMASEMIFPIIDLIIDSTFKVSWLMPLSQLIELTGPEPSTIALLTIYISCAIYMIATVLGGYYAFKKSELK